MGISEHGMAVVIVNEDQSIRDFFRDAVSSIYGDRFQIIGFDNVATAQKGIPPLLAQHERVAAFISPRFGHEDPNGGVRLIKGLREIDHAERLRIAIVATFSDPVELKQFAKLGVEGKNILVQPIELKDLDEKVRQLTE